MCRFVGFIWGICLPFTAFADSFEAVINEFSQGSGGYKEWVEILVISDLLDMRGWELGDLDDNSWNGGPVFANHSDFAALAAGTLLVIYNGDDVDGTIPGEDTNFSDKSVYLSSNNTNYFSNGWGVYANTDLDDMPALRNSAASVVHDMAVSHPSATVTTPGGGQAKMFMGESIAEIQVDTNWSTVTSSSATPGEPNGSNNTSWVIGLRSGATTNSSPTLTVPTTQFVLVGETLKLRLYAMEDDGDLVTLTASNLPANSSFYTTNGTGISSALFEFTPDASQSGMFYQIECYAEDKDGLDVQPLLLQVLDGGSCDVMFSQYLENSGNAALEIFNGTDSTVNFTQDQYRVEIYGYGSTNYTSSITLTGSVKSGRAFAVVSSNSDPALQTYADMIKLFFISGDDAVVLRKYGPGGPVLDTIGKVGEDPGQYWGTPPLSTYNANLSRNTNVHHGVVNPTNAFDPSVEWVVETLEDYSGFGSYSNGCGNILPPTSSWATISLAGTFNGWSLNSHVMTLVDDGIWEIVVGGPHMDSGNEFKFVANEDWLAGEFGDIGQSDTQIPISEQGDKVISGGNIVVDSALYEFVRFRFDENTTNYWISYSTADVLGVAGSFNGWNPTGNMGPVASNTWETILTFTNQTNLVFKFTGNNSWQSNWGAQDQAAGNTPIQDTATFYGSNITLSGTFNGPYRFRFNYVNRTYAVAPAPTAQETMVQDFDTWPGSVSYVAETFQGWSINTALISEPASLTGKCARLDDAFADGYSMFVMSPSNDAGLGTFTFWYRSWDPTPPVSFDIQVSANGQNTPGSWYTIDSITNVAETNYQYYATTIDSATNHFVRVIKTEGLQRLLIDECTLTTTNLNTFSINHISVAGPFNGFDPHPNMYSSDQFTWTTVLSLNGATNQSLVFYANGTTNYAWGDIDQSDFSTPIQGTADFSSTGIQIPDGLAGDFRVTFNPFTGSYAFYSNTYYGILEGLSGEVLRQALYQLISSGQVTNDYDALHGYYLLTDLKPDGTVWDMYSDIPNGETQAFVYFPVDCEQCGFYLTQGDCYNREHTWPRSWFGEAQPLFADLVCILPTDGWANGLRLNHPYGECASPTHVAKNGSRKGSSTFPGISGTVFEPVDAYKGDVARIFFYIYIRYGTEGTWDDGSCPIATGNEFDTGISQLLLRWHFQDPVSQKELARNEAAYGIQGNRNPFVDHAEWVTNFWTLDTQTAALPYLQITNPPAHLAVAGPSTETFRVEGVCNSNITGTLTWINEFNGSGGTVPATPFWAITDVPVDIGDNLVTISGTNSTGYRMSKQVRIARQSPALEHFENTNNWSESLCNSSWDQESSAMFYTNNSILPEQDNFYADYAVRESALVMGGSGHAWGLLQDGFSPYLEYTSTVGIERVSAYIAADLGYSAAATSLVLMVSTNSGTSFSTWHTWPSSWFGEDKVYQLWRSGDLYVEPEPGSNLVIRIVNSGNDNLYLDDFHVEYTVNPMDGDADGLPDIWETNFFMNTSVTDGSADSDGDQVSDHAEFLANSVPTNAADFLHFTKIRITNGVLWADWMSAEGKTYRLEGTWTTPETITETLGSGLEATPSTNSASTILNTSPWKLLRLRVE